MRSSDASHGHSRPATVATALAIVILAACSGAAPAATTGPTMAVSAAASPTITLAPIPTLTTIATPVPVATTPPTSLAPGQSPTGSSFILAGITTSFDQNAALPDASTFGSSFPASGPVYVEYELAPGLSGSVTGTLRNSAGTQLVSSSVDYPASGPWAWFKLTGYPPGAYLYRLLLTTN